jgi:hypothetical protein
MCITMHNGSSEKVNMNSVFKILKKVGEQIAHLLFSPVLAFFKSS